MKPPRLSCEYAALKWLPLGCGQQLGSIHGRGFQADRRAMYYEAEERNRLSAGGGIDGQERCREKCALRTHALLVADDPDEWAPVEHQGEESLTAKPLRELLIVVPRTEFRQYNDRVGPCGSDPLGSGSGRGGRRRSEREGQIPLCGLLDSKRSAVGGRRGEGDPFACAAHTRVATEASFEGKCRVECEREVARGAPSTTRPGRDPGRPRHH